MKKIILVDGNNLVFRSYFATAYSGRMMKNSKGFPTNAIYGFVNMINKIIVEEKPEYMAVAFDIGKNFRHDKYEGYKDGRTKAPDDLLHQIPVCKNIIRAMGIKSLECENYEADDIIGTIVKMTTEDKDYVSTIVSSDKDLLQLINFETEVKLLKSQGFIRYDEKTFVDEYGIKPIRIIDLKAIAGDSSDNIPGVKGIGDKGALKLLQEYGSLEDVYENIDNIKGATKDKLINDKDNAFFSKDLATIYQEVPLNIKLEDIKINDVDEEKVLNIYEELEFYSLTKDFTRKENIEQKEIIIIKNINELSIEGDASIYIECDSTNYHTANIIGIGLTDEKNSYFLYPNLIENLINKYNTQIKYTFDLKKNIVLLSKLGIKLTNIIFDMLVSSYLLEYNIKDDLSYLIKNSGQDCPLYEELLKSKFDEEKLISSCTLKSDYIYRNWNEHLSKLKLEDMEELYQKIEFPLVPVLADMELSGIKVILETLKDMSDTIKAKIEIITKNIHKMAEIEFNIASPKQLGEVLFEKMGIPYVKKKANKYSTDAKVLQKLIGTHPIIKEILEYRNLNKIYNTYLEGLPEYVMDDGKIHTIYKQTLTRTGRLSSIEPNLQNIPVRDEIGRKVRKAFVPSNDMFLCADYSQIELRIMAHYSKDEELINAFKNKEDIHTKVASDIFGVPKEAVTKEMRKSAKAVIFGIVYGISSFGLGENLEIDFVEAKKFIDKYLELYPGVKKYMDEIVKVAKEDGYVKTLYNRKRTIDELKNPAFMIRQAGERIALNTPIQGTAADILKLAMIEIDKKFKSENIKSKMILQVHDELIFDCLKSEKVKIATIVKEVMENICIIDVPIIVEIETGSNWYEA